MSYSASGLAPGSLQMLLWLYPALKGLNIQILSLWEAVIMYLFPLKIQKWDTLHVIQHNKIENVEGFVWYTCSLFKGTMKCAKPPFPANPSSRRTTMLTLQEIDFDTNVHRCCQMAMTLKTCTYVRMCTYSMVLIYNKIMWLP